MRLKTIASTFLIACSFAAAEPATKPSVQEPPPETQTKAEALKAFQKADKELNDVWAQVKKAPAPDVFRSLQEAQQGWISYRDDIATGIGNIPSGTGPRKGKANTGIPRHGSRDDGGARRSAPRKNQRPRSGRSARR